MLAQHPNPEKHYSLTHIDNSFTEYSFQDQISNRIQTFQRWATRERNKILSKPNPTESDIEKGEEIINKYMALERNMFRIARSVKNYFQWENKMREETEFNMISGLFNEASLLEYEPDSSDSILSIGKFFLNGYIYIQYTYVVPLESEYLKKIGMDKVFLFLETKL